MSDYRNILVFLPNWVGDVVMATPALRALRQRFPQARMTYIGRGVAVETVRGTSCADELMTDGSAKQGLCGLAAICKRLRLRDYDLAVLLPNSFRSAVVARVGARIGEVIGYDRDGRGVMLTIKLKPQRDKGRYKPVPTIDYYNAIAMRLGCDDPGWSMQLDVTPDDQTAADAMLAEAAGATAATGPLVMLNPGASFGPSKLWPAERFAAVADQLIERRNARIIINAAPSEKAIAQAVQAAMRHAPLINFADRSNTLGGLKAMLGRCELLITNDTGARHIAAARGCGLVTIFGSTDPVWARIDYARERMIRVDVPCSPCQQKVCTQPAGATFHQCMTAVAPEMVLAAAMEVLDLPAGERRGER